MNRSYNSRIAILAACVFALDQITKLSVLRFLPEPYHSEVHVLPGFFRLVHWHNTGAAWSMFHGNNLTLAVISAIAFIGLVLARRKFGSETPVGSVAMGLLFGGILGNLLDRLVHGHVIDFLYFHLITRSGKIYDFPAFNIADSAICIGVGLLFILSWRSEEEPKKEPAAPGGSRTSHEPTVRDIHR